MKAHFSTSTFTPNSKKKKKNLLNYKSNGLSFHKIGEQCPIFYSHFSEINETKLYISEVFNQLSCWLNHFIATITNGQVHKVTDGSIPSNRNVSVDVLFFIFHKDAFTFTNYYWCHSTELYVFFLVISSTIKSLYYKKISKSWNSTLILHISTFLTTGTAKISVMKSSP